MGEQVEMKEIDEVVFWCRLYDENLNELVHNFNIVPVALQEGQK